MLIFSHRKFERDKAIKHILKIIHNIRSNPSKLEKYGSLNAQRVKIVLMHCEPALQLLFIVGFTVTISDNKERLNLSFMRYNTKCDNRCNFKCCLIRENYSAYVLNLYLLQ